MNPKPCHSLDDFLAQDLNSEDLARFEAHLPNCSECQRTIQEEQSLDALLTEAVTQFEPALEGLSERVRHRFHAVRRRRLVAAGAAVAASVVVLVLVSRFVLKQEPIATLERVEVREELPMVQIAPAEHLQVRFPRAPEILAISVQSESPNVTLIQVYNGLREPPPSRSER